MRWFFGDGKPQELAYAGRVLDAMQDVTARVPMTWGRARIIHKDFYHNR
jgi:hypothetical protein